MPPAPPAPPGPPMQSMPAIPPIPPMPPMPPSFGGWRGGFDGRGRHHHHDRHHHRGGGSGGPGLHNMGPREWGFMMMAGGGQPFGTTAPTTPLTEAELQARAEQLRMMGFEGDADVLRELLRSEGGDVGAAAEAMAAGATGKASA
ncbi:hypothetical protein HK405_004870 [Cladochytrium tenue]|nr:hypothetical protein HK405_004870 [Cladochytrium tenue]